MRNTSRNEGGTSGAGPRWVLVTTALAVISALSLTVAISSGLANTGSSAQVACAAEMVCIYPEINYGGTPYVRRASDSSTSLAGSPINERTFSVISNGVWPRTARIYRSDSCGWKCSS
jgi:hypothetical protein